MQYTMGQGFLDNFTRIAIAPWLPGRTLTRQVETALTPTPTTQAITPKTPQELYPWASDSNVAEHIHYFLSNPVGFATEVMKTYNAQTTAAQKKNYADFIAKSLVELNAVNPGLLSEKFTQIPLNLHGEIAVNIWPPIQELFWVRWGQVDMNGFINAHLSNLAKMAPEDRAGAAAHIKNLWSIHFPNFSINDLTKENALLWLEVVEPEQFEELKIAQAGVEAQQAHTKFLAVGILGVFGVWALTKLF